MSRNQCACQPDVYPLFRWRVGGEGEVVRRDVRGRPCRHDEARVVHLEDLQREGADAQGHHVAHKLEENNDFFGFF